MNIKIGGYNLKPSLRSVIMSCIKRFRRFSFRRYTTRIYFDFYTNSERKVFAKRLGQIDQVNIGKMARYTGKFPYFVPFIWTQFGPIRD